jgi:glycosyltransferase involved in cell wall biosynthesis
MKVLLLHSRYLSGSSSGENRVVEDELRLLQDVRHDVVACQLSVESESSSLRRAADAVWSRPAVREVRQQLRDLRPDVVHIHSLYPRLSPAVLRVIPPHVAVVMTLHNFRLMCLPATYLRNGSICEDCAGRLPWRGVVHACYRDSRAASAALAVSLVVHRSLKSFARVDRFVAVSEFVRTKYIEAGIDAARIAVKSNFAWPTKRRVGAGGRVLFLGRVAREKGLDTVLRALPDTLELLVAGDGPERLALEQQPNPRVAFLGSVDAAAAQELLRSARALVVPSRWYEAQPRVILEAFATGVPVLASRIGALPELVEDGVNGRLVAVDDVAAWRRTLTEIADDDESTRLGDGAFAAWRRRFTPELGLQELETAYHSALELVARRPRNQPRPQ